MTVANNWVNNSTLVQQWLLSLPIISQTRLRLLAWNTITAISFYSSAAECFILIGQQVQAVFIMIHYSGESVVNCTDMGLNKMKENQINKQTAHLQHRWSLTQIHTILGHSAIY